MNCFVITPIGNENDIETRRMLESIREVIRPELQKLGYDEVLDSSEINEAGMISKQIRDHILSDDLVIANLSGLNANVMYELGVRHSTGRPVIHICKKGVSLPFDIRDFRTIFFELDSKSLIEFRESIEKTVRDTQFLSFQENPIFSRYDISPLSLRDSEEDAEGVYYITAKNENIELDLIHGIPLFCKSRDRIRSKLCDVDVTHRSSITINLKFSTKFRSLTFELVDASERIKRYEFFDDMWKYELDVSQLAGKQSLFVELEAGEDSAVAQVFAFF